MPGIPPAGRRMNLTATHFEIVLGTLFIVVAAVLLLQQRRTPQSTAAWLLFIIAVPYLAIPLFIALGFRKQGARFPPIRYSADGKDPPTPVQGELDDMFRRFGLPPARTGNRFELLDSPQSALGALMALVDGAEHSLDALFYVVSDDPVGEVFVDALERKARQGVAVRLAMDRLGSLRYPAAAVLRLREAGGEVRFFSPLLQAPDTSRLNLRNHRKMAIADGARVFAGGMNVGTAYMDPNPRHAPWTDLAFRVDGPVVQSYVDLFHSDWDVTGKTRSDVPPPRLLTGADTAVAQLVPSGPDMPIDALHDGVVRAIHLARFRVWLVTPYFVPTEQLDAALATAARRGVDVRILLPERSNQRIADRARGAYLREMAEAGCRVFLFRDGMIHAKTAVFDSAAYVGSANFDVRSMLLNFESALFLYDAESVKKLADWHLRQEDLCQEGLHLAGPVQRLAEGLFRLGAPIL